MKGSLPIVLFFVLGVICGRAGVFPEELSQNDGSLVVLCALIFCVGVTIGGDTATLAKFRTLNPGLLLLPVASVAGMMGGCLVVSLVLGGHTLSDWLAVGSGMGYYSLSSVIITECRGAELGTVALLSNIVREMVTLLLAPLLVRFFGTLAPIAAAGATAMDTTLPIITRVCGARYVPVSVYCGMVTDFSVPFLVTLFFSL